MKPKFKVGQTIQRDKRRIRIIYVDKSGYAIGVPRRRDGAGWQKAVWIIFE